MPVVVLVADGARLDAFEGDLDDLPALRRLRAEGGLHPVTSVFPSVTGPAYSPFLTGRFPGPVGLPGIRWFDRSRAACTWPDYARSYVGYQFGRVDEDLDGATPTIFELVPGSVGAMSVLTRGLTERNRYGTLTARSAIRVAMTHFLGRADRWLQMDREVLETIPRRLREDRPPFVFAAMVGVDKASHAWGHDSRLVRDALRLVDATAARIRDDAERGGWWDETHLWIASDHGHSRLDAHDDLAEVVADTGVRTISHPFTVAIDPDVAVMVSGNAMAHVYLGLGDRVRRGWPALRARWSSLAALLLERPATDLLLLPYTTTECELRSARFGNAQLSKDGCVYRYMRTSGDPLQIGCDVAGDADDAYDATRYTSYPDAIVQIMSLAGCARSGDMILSAAPGWDFRARYEPIPHRSAHGALHRDHMLVPLLTNRVPMRAPRRTADVFASALYALGVRPPTIMDGRSFL